jgi:TrmH family RNA methyltransferase
MLITSTKNPRVKQIVALRERRERMRTGLTRVEGYEELSLALDSGAQPRTLYVCPDLIRLEQQALVEQIQRTGAEVIEVSLPVFERMAYREGPDGWLATFPSPEQQLADLRLSDLPFVVVGEAIEKPGNLGAIVRTADAAGVDAIVSSATLTDWGNPNVVRASKGALFSMQVAQASNDDTLIWLREHRMQVVVATPSATARYTDVDLRVPVAIVVGTEKHGVSERWLHEADIAVQIPMFGKVNSLNVATATALLIYEVVRQRSMSNAQRAPE